MDVTSAWEKERGGRRSDVTRATDQGGVPAMFATLRARHRCRHTSLSSVTAGSFSSHGSTLLLE